jgi:hypothetical protein
VFLSAETISQNSALLSDRITRRTSGLVRRYRVLNEERRGANYWVQIKADVRQDKLKEELAQLHDLLKYENMPRVFVVLAEQWLRNEGNTTGRIDIRLMESEMISRLKAKGFLLIDPDVLTGKLEISQVYSSGDVSDGIARKVGDLSGAELVIYGRGVVRDNGRAAMMGDFHSFQADIAIRAVNTSTGEIVATSMRSLKEAGDSMELMGGRALKKATEQAAGDLVLELSQQWQAQMAGSRRVVLKVGGVDFAAAGALEALLKKVPGVQRVTRRSLKGDQAQIDVRFRGEAQKLAERIDALQWKHAKVSISAQRGDLMELKWTKK